MEPRFCAGPIANGPLLTPEQQRVNASIFPLWLGGTPEDVLTGLNAIAFYALDRNAQVGEPYLTDVRHLIVQDSGGMWRCFVELGHQSLAVPCKYWHAALQVGSCCFLA